MLSQFAALRAGRRVAGRLAAAAFRLIKVTIFVPYILSGVDHFNVRALSGALPFVLTSRRGDFKVCTVSETNHSHYEKKALCVFAIF